MARLVWTERALGDLQALLEFIERDSPLAARRFAQQIMVRVERLQAFPLYGGLVAEDETRRYREVLQGNYRVIYRADKERVYLVAVHHAARLLQPSDLE
ncbi:MAG: type II toxin-antitoxin system RelE/ParE family toxin [Planctomycetota bacterium]